jgi:nucleotide-binding universal stress UspA family protein
MDRSGDVPPRLTAPHVRRAGLSTMTDTSIDTEPNRSRIFLCVVDESAEMGIAVRYACRRARSTGGHVALLFVIEPAEIQSWGAVEALMREEQRTEAEQALHRLAKEVHRVSGAVPVFYVREGHRRDEVLRLIDEDPTISVLVLGAGTGPEGPGPLVTFLAGKGGANRLRVPLTIVPGGLTPDQVDAIS